MVRAFCSARPPERIAFLIAAGLAAATPFQEPKAAIRGFRVAGKTGTSQKVDPKTKRYSRTKFVAVFVGFVPLDRPKLVILVVIDEPKGIAYGGVVAAPVFKQVGKWVLNHLRVNPSKGLSSMARASSPILKRRGPLRAARDEGARGRAVDSRQGSRVVVSEDSYAVQRIALELRKGFLPDFIGQGMREVLKRGRSLGLEVDLEGTGLAFKQEPAPGESLQGISRVRVHFRPPG